jgi:hypothetical protein
VTKHHSALRGVALALVMTLATEGCGDDDPKADPSPTTSTSETSSPTESSTPTPTIDPETPEQAAVRLATEQTKAYLRTADRLFANPKLPLSILDDYARDQALLEIKDSIEKRRDRGERLVGHTTVTKSWLGPEKVVFNGKAPMAVVDLYICYKLNGNRFVDQQGIETPVEPQVGQARYAIYADDWPNDDPMDWRVGKEYAAGEPCAQ